MGRWTRATNVVALLYALSLVAGLAMRLIAAAFPIRRKLPGK